MFCRGCGQDVSQSNKDRRTLSGATSIPVVNLLRNFLETAEDELEIGRRQIDVEQFLHPEAKMCRKCYSAYERFLTLQNTIKTNLIDALNAIAPSSSKRIKLAPPCPQVTMASQQTTASCSKTSSPVVSVSSKGLFHHMHFSVIPYSLSTCTVF